MRLNPDQDKLINSIISLLIERTRKGKVRWQQADQPDTFIAHVGENSVTLTGVVSLTGFDALPEIIVRDPAGNARAKAVATPWASLANPGFGIDFNQLVLLSKLVRKQVTEVDPILLEIEKDLRDER